MNNNKLAIEFNKVFFKYIKNNILSDVSFTLNENDSLCIVGPNGGGKTTLLKLILGLIQPTKGTICIFGEKPKYTQTMIGYTPQILNFDPLFPIRVIDIVLMGCLRKNAWSFRYNADDIIVAKKAMHDMKIESLAKKKYSELSGGQRKRVLIARALASSPKLLLLDEPTANIDMEMEAKIFKQLKKLRRRITVLMVSHNINLVSNLVEKVLCVRKTVAMHSTSIIKENTAKYIFGTELRAVRHSKCINIRKKQ